MVRTESEKRAQREEAAMRKKKATDPAAQAAFTRTYEDHGDAERRTTFGEIIDEEDGAESEDGDRDYSADELKALDEFDTIDVTGRVLTAARLALERNEALFEALETNHANFGKAEHDGLLRPAVEHFTTTGVAWLPPVPKGAKTPEEHFPFAWKNCPQDFD
ncbi:hypothetical protein LTR08_004468 [Meristemomyces frigidus]|nr:hypothetical protein LTR08_004468 [Meristemomyces frigidus]